MKEKEEKVEIKCLLCDPPEVVLSSKDWDKIKENRLGFIDRQRVRWLRAFGGVLGLELGSPENVAVVAKIQFHWVKKHKKKVLSLGKKLGGNKLIKYLQISGFEELKKHGVML